MRTDSSISAASHGGPPSLARQRGLTLAELLVAIAVMALLFGWAIPSFQALSARHEVSAEILRLKTALALARNTAIARRTTVTVCPSHDGIGCNNDDWTAPLMVIQGRAEGGNIGSDEVLRILDDSRVASVSYRQDNRPVRYGALGRPAGHNGTFHICGRHDAGARVIVSNFGRVRVDDTPTC
ncbi:prepilin-type N-terminal cleavage/methylation domain-containing protein [Halomonas sp. DQ26W]|uniref:GspH/FimT family pseudopilin n=1 Tax=Halomonas sp. DQ26W TaxID=2282311 RepID=UPI000DF79EB3|nr:GspH/FimT family pseudopilin [Halomonas sp. DQ26W]RDB42492.1 prepilin-type N-terminal cleavage/methylation domain-containing protein [Halomonas sp. DQ26W]